MAKKKTETPVEETEKTDEKAEETKESVPDAEEAKEAPKKKSTKGEIKLFNRWSFSDVETKDPSLVNYINLTPIIVPHSGGKHEHKRFWKTERVSIVERYINKMLAPGFVRRRIKGRGASLHSGKKQKLLKIIENAFSLIEEKSGNNPIQVLVDAVCNVAPREETTKISLGGISYQTAVDIAPQRRVDLGVRLLVQTSVGQTYSNLKTIDECIANELMAAANKDQNSRAIKKRDEMERIALSAR